MGGWVCLCVCVGGWVCYHAKLKIVCIDPHQTGFVGKGSDHLQLIKIWPSRTPGKGVCSRAKIFGSTLLQPACSVCIPLNTFSLLYRSELSLNFNDHFPGGPGLAGTGMYPFWILLEIRVLKVVVTTGAISRAKLQSEYHHQQTNTQVFYRLDALPVAQP